MLGCTTQQYAPRIQAPAKAVQDTNVTQTYAPAPPKKKIELKEVEDTNFSSEYMYPEAKRKKGKPVAVVQTDTRDETETVPSASTKNMDRGECISMIGQEKFDKYTQMLGDEASAIKRCQMLKAM